ncbi:GHKL domain-containing protein [Enterococcus sp. 669A]|uniref:GHKL domain-containing protein n=1 Tax=Candidatus Enterococcus moelleringii TaxID=2815325 RepID=A0ABS3LA01_9ENTE|nr:GHKL domain-containing protein [Enterococcus sp. 669A]MBO1306459.1 GHKL domain-containing protein [Enterococcus sp. 669A]
MVELVLISTEMLLANLFLWDRCAKRRHSVAATVLCYVLFRLFLIFVGNVLKSIVGTPYESGPLVILSGFLYIIPIFFLYETRILKLVNIFFFLWTYTFSLYSISYFTSLFFTAGRQMTIFAATQTLLYALTFYYYYSYFIPKYSYMIDHISEQDERWFSALSVSWFFVLFALYMAFAAPNLVGMPVFVFFLFLGIVALSSRLIYNLVITRNQMLQLELRFDHQLAQYQDQKRHAAEIRKLSHDINKYNSVIQYALKEKNYEYLAEFCDSAFETLRLRPAFQETGNETLDALIYHLVNQCSEKGIELTLDLDPALTGSIEIAPLSLTTILGNLFENAVEACELMPEDQRWINVTIRPDGARVHTVIKNSCNQLEKNNRQGMKRLLPKHIGTTLVEQTVKKIGGMVKYQREENQYEVVLILANRNLSN